MCFKHKSVANRTPLASIPLGLRARTMDSTRAPYKKPLYWKWTWSIISRPGDSRMERATACACLFDEGAEVLTKLCMSAQAYCDSIRSLTGVVHKPAAVLSRLQLTSENKWSASCHSRVCSPPAFADRSIDQPVIISIRSKRRKAGNPASIGKYAVAISNDAVVSSSVQRTS